MHLTLQLLLGRQEAATLTTNGLPLDRLLSDASTSGSDSGSLTTWRQLADKGTVVQVVNRTGSMPSSPACRSVPPAAKHSTDGRPTLTSPSSPFLALPVCRSAGS